MNIIYQHYHHRFVQSPSFILPSSLPSFLLILPSFFPPPPSLTKYIVWFLCVCNFNVCNRPWITHLILFRVAFQTGTVFLRPNRAVCVYTSAPLQGLHGGCPHFHPKTSLGMDTFWLPTPRHRKGHYKSYPCMCPLVGIRISLGCITSRGMAESPGVSILNLMK